jgi:arylsulfatase A-like enzyme/Flp pilus assembly protein TadD
LKYILQFLTVLAALLPCGLAATVPARRPAPNVVLITIDTVRADHVGCYGATKVKTPTLDGLARDGIVFERAISQVPLTWPSHAAILTGTYPFQNGVQDFTGQPLDPRFRSVAQIFKQQGYTTGAVVSAFVLDRSWGLARGFDYYDDAFSAEAFRHKDIGLVDRKAGESVTRAISWLLKTPRRPFFFWLHLYDPHSPYDPPEPFRSLYKGHLYDGEIAYADHELGRLIGWLKQNQLYDRTAIVLLSDHGESLGDHGEKEHGFFVYNSTVHIPLIVKPPTGSGFRPGRVARPVETVAVAPTLTRLAGMKNEIQKQFSSPGLLSDSTENDTASYSESFYSFSSFGWSPLHALQTSRYHYIEAPTPELYDVIADPQEKNNLASQQTATVAVLEDKLQSLLQHNPFKLAGSGNSGLSPEALEKLRALGYVAYRSPVSPEALAAGLPDPKSKLWEFNAILDAGDAFHAGDFPTGEALLARVQEKDPQMSAVPYMLGEAALRQQKWDQAAAELQKSLELDSNFDQAMTALARALHEKGDDAGARQWLEKALQRNSQNFRAWYELGWLQARTGNNQDAQAAYEKVLAIQPNFALAQRDLGLIYFDRKDYQHATPYLLQATQLGLKEARVFNFLGICYDRTGRLSRAVQSYRQALQLDANLAEVHLNLGYAYEQLNRKSLAAQEYGKTCRLSVDLCRLIQRQKR